MGQVCTICSHPDRLQIDRQIVRGVPHLRIGKNYDLTDTAVRNHAQNHVTRQMLKSGEIMERANAAVLLDEIDICMTKAKGILAQAEKDQKPGLQLQALREIRQTIEFLSKLAISLAQLQQERELALMPNGDGQRTVIILPQKISLADTATKAATLYRQMIDTTKTNPGADISFADEPEQEQTDRPMIRKRPSSAERVKLSSMAPGPEPIDLEPEEQDDPDLSILDWQPNIPAKQSTWGR